MRAREPEPTAFGLHRVASETAGKLLCILAALVLIFVGYGADFSKTAAGHRVFDHDTLLSATQPRSVALKHVQQERSDGSGSAGLPAESFAPERPIGHAVSLLPSPHPFSVRTPSVGWFARAPPVVLILLSL